MTQRRMPARLHLLSLLVSIMLPVGRAHAQLAPSWERIKLSDSLLNLKFSGDLRLRHDASAKRGNGTIDRGRSRFRLRVASELTLPDNLSAFLRLASGTGEQVSTNQSFGNLSTQKNIFINLAYAKWAPPISETLSGFLAMGKMQNFLWRTYSSDLLFDDDFNPEGFSQGAEWLLPGAGLTLFANGLQTPLTEGSASGKSPWLFSQQAGVETRLPFESRLRVACAYHKFSDEQRASFGAGVAQDGNRRTATSTTGLLHNRFGVAEVTAQLSGWAGKLPVNAQATVARNMRARGDLAGETRATRPCPVGQTCPAARDGFQVGAVVGSAKAAGSWEAAYFRKYSQTDVTVADLADSDFGDGGTNRKGHIVWLAYAPRDWMQLRAKAFFTETIDTQFASPGDKAINRLQVDLNLKF